MSNLTKDPMRIARQMEKKMGDGGDKKQRSSKGVSFVGQFGFLKRSGHIQTLTCKVAIAMLA